MMQRSTPDPDPAPAGPAAAAERVRQIVARWRGSPLARHFAVDRELPAGEARTRPFPEWVDPRLVAALGARGISRLYLHQWEAAEAFRRGRSFVVATPTASGKTLCYNLPVFQELLRDPAARALYLFPTKALARDQLEEVRALAASLGSPIGAAVYDGDTPPDERRASRRRARIIATNPDMLHTAILPHHPAWAELFAGLRCVVVDELHVYRGVFGSNVAQVLRRLQRIARFHGADPVFVCTSATIANPAELGERLLGRRVQLVADSGAPCGPRHFLIYNPPVRDAALGTRESYLKASCAFTSELIAADVETLVFCRSRLAVEVLLRHLRDAQAGDRPRAERAPDPEALIRGYRGGYLPARRRSVEGALRRGDTRAVVATSALELGIDVGGIDAVVIAGWPGSRAAVWQRAGRAGRRLAPSLAVLVASSEPLDQYVAADPEYLLGQAPEHALIDPDNVSILVPHVKCAAYELPFAHGEGYGALPAPDTEDVLGCLSEASILHRSARGYSYVGDAYPAGEVQLRGGLDENFLVVRRGAAGFEDQVIAEVDFEDATQELHEHAIYQLEGRQYEVQALDHEAHKAYVVPVDVDYYTDALTQTRVRVLHGPESGDSVALLHGEIHVVQRVVGFKKIKLHTGENVGFGEVTQPDREMHTTALWLTVPPPRVAALARTPAEVASATLAMARALHTAAALLLMSDSRDLGRAVGDLRSSWVPVVGRSGAATHGEVGGAAELGPYAPTVFLFDRFAGGVGLSARLFDERAELLRRTQRIIAGCRCDHGCPACIGPAAALPVADSSAARPATKRLALRLVEAIQAAEAEQRPTEQARDTHASTAL